MANFEAQAQTLFDAFASCTPEDVDGLISLFSADAIFHGSGNTKPPLTGHEEMRAGLKQMFTAITDFKFRFIHVAGNERVIFIERFESFTYLKQHKVELSAIGVVDIGVDGKFTAFREYFDPKILEGLS
jgi:limonene-1,2-epoxide hydrolase